MMTSQPQQRVLRKPAEYRKKKRAASAMYHEQSLDESKDNSTTLNNSYS